MTSIFLPHSVSLSASLCTSLTQWSKLPPCNLPNREAHVAGNWGGHSQLRIWGPPTQQSFKSWILPTAMQLRLKAWLSIWVLGFLCAWPAPWTQHCKEILEPENSCPFSGPPTCERNNAVASEQVIYSMLHLRMQAEETVATGVYSQYIKTWKTKPRHTSTFQPLANIMIANISLDETSSRVQPKVKR